MIGNQNATLKLTSQCVTTYDENCHSLNLWSGVGPVPAIISEFLLILEGSVIATERFDLARLGHRR